MSRAAKKQKRERETADDRSVRARRVGEHPWAKLLAADEHIADEVPMREALLRVTRKAGVVVDAWAAVLSAEDIATVFDLRALHVRVVQQLAERRQLSAVLFNALCALRGTKTVVVEEEEAPGESDDTDTDDETGARESRD